MKKPAFLLILPRHELSKLQLCCRLSSDSSVSAKKSCDQGCDKQTKGFGPSGLYITWAFSHLLDHSGYAPRKLERKGMIRCAKEWKYLFTLFVLYPWLPYSIFLYSIIMILLLSLLFFISSLFYYIFYVSLSPLQIALFSVFIITFDYFFYVSFFYSYSLLYSYIYIYYV